MNHRTDPYIAARRAALAVHALAAEDRSWVLARLHASQTQVLAPLLRELQELGFQCDRGALQQVDRGVPSGAAQELLAGAMKRGIRGLAFVLQQEPPAVTGLLLSACDEPLRDALLGSLDPQFADRVRRHPLRPSAAPALVTALTEALERRLQGLPPNLRRRRSWWRESWRSEGGTA